MLDGTMIVSNRQSQPAKRRVALLGLLLYLTPVSLFVMHDEANPQVHCAMSAGAFKIRPDMASYMRDAVRPVYICRHT